MSLRGKTAREEEFVFIIASMVVIPTWGLVFHPRLRILHQTIEAVPTFLFRDLAETVQIQYLRGGGRRPALHLVQDKQARQYPISIRD